jgi:hypothetical protein
MRILSVPPDKPEEASQGIAFSNPGVRQ